MGVKGWLESGEENIVVHCAAGLHRTGIFLFVLLRECGETPDQALETIRHIRQFTFNEFEELNFHPKAEAIFAMVGSDSAGSAGSAGGPSVVEVVSERTCEVAPEEEEVDCCSCHCAKCGLEWEIPDPANGLCTNCGVPV